MAIKKETELPSGVTGNYWRITGLNIVPDVNATAIEIALYKSEQARRLGKASILRKNLKFDGQDNPINLVNLETKNPFELAYTKIKALEEFKNSEDI